MGRKGAALAALAFALAWGAPQGAGAWEIGSAAGSASTIIGSYADAGLFGPEAAPPDAAEGRDPPVLDDEAAACAPDEDGDEACDAVRRIVVDRARPLDPSAVGALLGAAGLRPSYDKAGPAAIDPATVLDLTPVYAPDVGASKWRTVLFSIEGMTRRGPRPLESNGPVRSMANFIGALLRPLAVLAFLIIFVGTSILVFKRTATR